MAVLTCQSCKKQIQTLTPRLTRECPYCHGKELVEVEAAKVAPPPGQIAPPVVSKPTAVVPTGGTATTRGTPSAPVGASRPPFPAPVAPPNPRPVPLASPKPITPSPLRRPDPVERQAPRSASHGAPEPTLQTSPTAASPRLLRLVPRQGAGVRPAAQRSCPALAHGNCYLSVGQSLLALNAMTQEILWEYPTGGPIPGSPTVGADQGIRVHSGDHRLHCVDALGKPRWEPVTVGQPLGWASPLVDEAGNTWISAYGGGLIKVDPRGTMTGKLFLRSFTKFDSTGLLYNGVLYIGGEDACVHAIELNGERGHQRWDHEAKRGRTGWFINAAVALGPGPTLVVASHDNHIHFFNLDGESHGAVKLEGEILGAPIVGPDFLVYVGIGDTRRAGTQAGSLVCIDGKSRKRLWTYAAAGPVESTPVLGNDGIVYCGDNAGRIHALDHAGKALWTELVAAPVRSPGAILWNERLAFGLDDGTTAILHCSSKGLARGWPKLLGTAGQSGVASLS